MSGSGYVSRGEFETLLTAVQDLQVRVTEVAAAVARLSPAASTAGEFEVVDPTPAVASSVAQAAAELSADRLLVAQQIGAWIRRCLSGEARGLSGREKLNLQSRFYIVVRGFDLVVHDPPLVFPSWSGAKAACYSHGQPGDSIFVGVPSKAEVRAVLVAAGLSLPADYRREHA